MAKKTLPNHDYPSQELIELVLDLILTDVAEGDLTAIELMLSEAPAHALVNYLRDE
jgi:hypothetical protein